MKTNKNNTIAMQLPGALALAAAGAATQANAATVQITFTGSYISTTGSNNLVTDHLDYDFGNDGVNEILFARQQEQYGEVLILKAVGGAFLAAAANYRAVYTGSWGSKGPRHQGVALVGQYPNSVTDRALGENPTSPIRDVSATGNVPITFSDANIRGGLSTTGYLNITAALTQSGQTRMITVNSLTYDDAVGGGGTSAVPEPSGLALLALGAGGLLARRRRAMAA